MAGGEVGEDSQARARGCGVTSRGKKPLAEEMSDAYQDVTEVLKVMYRAGISRLVARLEPLGVSEGWTAARSALAAREAWEIWSGPWPRRRT